MSKKPSAIDASTVLATKEKSPGAPYTGALQRGQTVTETLRVGQTALGHETVRASRP